MTSKFLPPQQQMQQNQVAIDIKQTTPIVCECGNYTFERVTFLRALSAIASPSGKDEIVPIMAYACNSCGVVPSRLVPPIIREEAISKQTETTSTLTLLP